MGDTRKLWIPGPAGRLEAVLRTCERPRAAAVVAHPHPLHGGTLHNPVVFHADRALNRAGLVTLRFNFRGVGDSEGEHDEGPGEAEDVAAAFSWLRGIAPSVPLLSVGYSFGAVCSSVGAARDAAVHGLIGIGLPVRLYPFDELDGFGRPLAVVQGDADEFGTIEELRRRLEGLSPPAELLVLDGAPHLFPGRATEVASLVVRAAESMLQP